MSVFEALVLGIVQGLTEFLPISSSGHLTLAPFFFGWDEPTLAFAVAVHVGTLVAVVAVYKATVMALVRALFGWRDAPESDKNLIKLLVFGTVPAVIIGAVFHDAVADAFERPVLAALLLGVTGYFLLSSETIADHREADPVEGQRSPRQLDDMTTKDSVAIGIAQAAAILPGISRSGATIGAGLRLGLTRETAAAFSFLLSIPVIAGAAIFEIPDMLDERAATGAAAFAVGMISAGVSGYFAIKWFLGVIRRRGLRPFGVYCLLLMVAGILTALARG